MTATIKKAKVNTLPGWGNISDPTPVYTAVGDDCEAVVMAVDEGGYRVRFNGGLTFVGRFADLADAQAFADDAVA